MKSVKSVVQFLWLRLAAPSLRACVESSSPVTPSQTWSNHFPCLDHERKINGSACPSTIYTPSHEATHRNQSNPVKPGQTNGMLDYWSNGEMVKFSHQARQSPSFGNPQLPAPIMPNPAIFCSAIVQIRAVLRRFFQAARALSCSTSA